MRRTMLVLALVVAFGCAGLGSLLGGDGGPEEAFAVAKTAYVAAFRSAATYIEVCQSQPPTERCDTFTVSVYEDVNPKAREAIAFGEGILAGVLPPGVSCDELADPGCEEKLRAQQLERMATLLQHLAIALNTRR